MPHKFARLRRFRFNLPQRIAAGLLLCFLAQGFWLIGRSALTERDYRYASCGRALWQSPLSIHNDTTACSGNNDGIFAYRVAGLPITIDLFVERALDHFRAPESRVLPSDAPASVWELRHQLPLTLWLVRLPFLAAACLLGGALWWVTRRLFGNLGGYTALALYCFSPAVLKAATSPSPELLAALGVYGSIYTAIGVAHAMQGPRRKWRPRIVLLTLAFGLAASAHLAALAVALLLGFCLMLWIAEGRRTLILPILFSCMLGALLLLFACCGFSPEGFTLFFRSSPLSFTLSLDAARHFFTLPHMGIALATLAALAIYLAVPRSRYFGNTAPLLCAALLMLLTMTSTPATPWLWSLPFLYTFIAGVFADAYESTRPRLALILGGAVLLLQVGCSLTSLAGLI
jgi:hypothetical protein